VVVVADVVAVLVVRTGRLLDARQRLQQHLLDAVVAAPSAHGGRQFAVEIAAMSLAQFGALLNQLLHIESRYGRCTST
jgi:hypothetical protein